jgi:hypothetical protein
MDLTSIGLANALELHSGGLGGSPSRNLSVTEEDLAYLKALVERLEREIKNPRPHPTSPLGPMPSGSRGRIGYRLLGQERGFLNKKTLYLTFLKSVCALTTAEEFAELVSRLRDHGGKRPYIALTPAALFPGNPGLVDAGYYSRLKTCAEQWYVDTNLSGATMNTVLHRACRALRLVQGVDYAIWGL